MRGAEREEETKIHCLRNYEHRFERVKRYNPLFNGQLPYIILTRPPCSTVPHRTKGMKLLLNPLHRPKGRLDIIDYFRDTGVSHTL